MKIMKKICLISQVLEHELLNFHQMEKLIQSNITIINGNMIYFSLYFVYVLAIFQSIHKYFDTSIQIPKHTYNIFITSLMMGFMKILHNLLFLLKVHQNRLKYTIFQNMKLCCMTKQLL